MPSFKKRTLLGVAGAITAVVAVACGSSDSDPTSANVPASQPTATTSSAPDPTATSSTLPVVDPTATPALGAPAATAVPPTLTEVPSKTVSGTLFDWRIDDIGQGTKPAITVNDDGIPSVSYMLEAFGGYVMNAQLFEGGWSITEVAEGYFYGPLDVDTGPDGQPRIAWHDHQADTFQPNLGDVEYAALGTDGVWKRKTLFDRGHDGWDTRLFIDDNGTVHVSGLDPIEFGGSGVEYYQLSSDTAEPVVEQVGSGPQTYRWATSVAADGNGRAYVTYYDQDQNDLVVAVRDGGEWIRETVDSVGSAGVFNDIMIGPDGRLHVSYVTLGNGSNGTVKYATRDADESEWVITVIAELSAITLGFEGARNITSIDVAPDGNPWIAFGDESRTSLAVFDGSDWAIEDIETSDDQGLQVSLSIDPDGRPHIGFFRLTNRGPLDGVIRYAVGTPAG